MIEKLLIACTKKAYHLATRPFELNIIGVRSMYPVQNSFDDMIHVLHKRANAQWFINSFKATTDPGTYWLKNLMNPKGTAIVKPGQYKNSHRIGVHRGKYQALVQQNPLTVYRDDNKNDVIDWAAAKQETGIFGINIHRASINGTTVYVDKHSAGCQVLADSNNFDLLMHLAHQHKKLYGNNFTYTLFNEKDVA